jgi:hypothetical protein
MFVPLNKLTNQLLLIKNYLIMFNYTLDEFETIIFGIETLIFDAQRLDLTNPEEVKCSDIFIREAEKLLERVIEQRNIYEKLVKAPIMGLFLFLIVSF